MAKIKTKYVCQHCGYQTPKWLGKCPACEQWDCLQEEIQTSEKAQRRQLSTQAGAIFPLDGENSQEERSLTSSTELNRLLGGGLVHGSATLIGGEPGVGKSTLVLQCAALLAKEGQKVLYISGEESLNQIRLRAKRLQVHQEPVKLMCETNLATILKVLEEEKPNLVLIDSVQMLFKEEIPSAPGTVTQVRECSSELIFFCKRYQISLFLIGHLTKSGEIAGPRVLEHLVDTVLYFEGDHFQNYRLLRAFKNRFGATNEVGVFEMSNKGLIDVPNPSCLFLSNDRNEKNGSIVVPCMEGTRPILVELQALTIQATFGSPVRKASGLDANRLSVILAILEKHLGVLLRTEDIFINAAGGISVKEPALDLGIAIAVLSSYLNKSVPAQLAAFAEIGLDGQLRPTTHLESRLKELEKLGFTEVIIGPNKYDYKSDKLKITVCQHLTEAIDSCFKNS